jgi:hypothetical protein
MMFWWSCPRLECTGMVDLPRTHFKTLINTEGTFARGGNIIGPTKSYIQCSIHSWRFDDHPYLLLVLKMFYYLLKVCSLRGYFFSIFHSKRQCKTNLISTCVKTVYRVHVENNEHHVAFKRFYVERGQPVPSSARASGLDGGYFSYPPP